MSIVRVNGGVSHPYNPYLNLAEAVVNGREQQRERKKAEREAIAEVGPAVYYVWRNELVKIGHTVNLRMRLAQLGVKRTALLALELGPMELEQRRHEQFVAHRIHGTGLGVEHYWPAAPIVAHVNDLRSAMGLSSLVVRLRPAA